MFQLYSQLLSVYFKAQCNDNYAITSFSISTTSHLLTKLTHIRTDFLFAIFIGNAGNVNDIVSFADEAFAFAFASQRKRALKHTHTPKH